MRNRRGITLIELLVALVIAAIIAATAARSFSFALTAQQRLDDAHLRDQRIRAFEQRLVDLIRGAEVTSSATNEASFFIGADSPDSLSGGGGLEGSNATSLTFTTFGGRINASTLDSDDDFETLNQNVGPQGGVTEVSLSMTPVGTPTGVEGGLYLREQKPADGDPTQGGFESQLNADVTNISFEFFDGEAWQTSWDTRTQQGVRRIPAAVRVTYNLSSDTNDQSHVLVIRLPHSDVTVDNPATQTAGATQ
ncbi:MAG: prepilin-type N-terminal cleavage/methylation domain-containing protein [Armatimonadetes bacterium]|nr:prepilin-type N-terminal cleavage/methylation domain-containing protein [Armatimonadota bacterium]